MELSVLLFSKNLEMILTFFEDLAGMGSRIFLMLARVGLLFFLVFLCGTG